MCQWPRTRAESLTLSLDRLPGVMEKIWQTRFPHSCPTGRALGRGPDLRLHAQTRDRWALLSPPTPTRDRSQGLIREEGSPDSYGRRCKQMRLAVILPSFSRGWRHAGLPSHHYVLPRPLMVCGQVLGASPSESGNCGPGCGSLEWISPSSLSQPQVPGNHAFEADLKSRGNSSNIPAEMSG